MSDQNMTHDEIMEDLARLDAAEPLAERPVGARDPGVADIVPFSGGLTFTELEQRRPAQAIGDPDGFAVLEDPITGEVHLIPSESPRQRLVGTRAQGLATMPGWVWAALGVAVLMGGK